MAAASSRWVLYCLGRAFRETGLALDRLGCRLEGNLAFKEELSRHRPVMPLYDQKPRLATGAFIAPSACVVGDVSIGSSTSIMYGATLRGDVNQITVGSNSFIGDNAVIHVSGENQKSGEPAPTNIGNFVSVGNNAMIHGATLRDCSSVEMGATVFDKAVVESNSIVGAGSVVTAGTVVPSGELWSGAPAKFVRKLTPEEESSIKNKAENWKAVGVEHVKNSL